MKTRFAIVVIVFVTAACRRGAPVPGEAAFNNANRLITIHTDKTAFGNGPEAVKLAERFGSTLKVFRHIAFTEGNASGPTLTNGEFLTFCQLTDGAVLFLVHVPELRHFTEDAQASLLKLAWTTARSVTKDIRGARELKLGVGLRGVLLYGGVAVGSASSAHAAQLNTGTSEPVETLYPFFVDNYPEHVFADSAPAPAAVAAGVGAATTPSAVHQQ